MLEHQELYCHNCNGYVQFSLDTELDGAYILNCPNCGHEHYIQQVHGTLLQVQVLIYMVLGQIQYHRRQNE